METRDVTLAPRCRRDVNKGARESCSEAQEARATSSRGYFGVYTVRIHPCPACGALAPVTGATPGLCGRIGSPTLLQAEQVRKGVKEFAGDFGVNSLCNIRN